MEVLDYLIPEDKREFKCYAILKDLIVNDRNFRKIIEEGITEGKIFPFPDELWDKLEAQNLRAPGVDSFVDIFREGANLGYCTVAAKQVSYSLPRCYICGGTVTPLVGTINAPDGRHTWIEFGNKVIDTTLVLIIDKDYTKKLGYNEENRYDPNIEPVYCAAKEMTNDPHLRNSNKR